MMHNLNSSNIPQEPKEATKFITEYLFNYVYPVILKIRKALQTYDGPLCEEDLSKIQDVYILCISQMKKSLQNMFDILREEYHEKVFLQESRLCNVETLSWYYNKLMTVEQQLGKTEGHTSEQDSSSDSLFATPMYFVNWIDHTFDVLSKLANNIYNTDCKESKQDYENWKLEIVDCVSTLHISLEELLLSAMTLCKYCLVEDQHIIRARCQVVLREAKALLGELIEGDLDIAYKATPEHLKLPLMPSNVNILIDVLKDVLYVLETNTNTALLGLLIHCFSNSVSPVDVLIDHINKDVVNCACSSKDDNDVEDCPFVKDFDLYNERLQQIGLFAVSCSSDHNRVTSLRSALASLSSLEPHLVPAVSRRARSAVGLAAAWRREVDDLRDTVFLIVDPAAFAEKSKQLIHKALLDIVQRNQYENSRVRSVIDSGCVVHALFAAYAQHEPEALAQHDKLVPMLADLDKVQLECKIVSNLLSSASDFVYDVKKVHNKGVNFDQLLKRLKLLYTLVSRINSLLHPKENEDQYFGCDIEDEPQKNMTHTVFLKNADTYVHSPKKPMNMLSRSIFARTTNVRSPAKNFPLARLTKHLQEKKAAELSFSVQLDELFNLSEYKQGQNTAVTKHRESLKEPSILYNCSPKKRSSLRKAVLSKHFKLPLENDIKRNVQEESVSSEQAVLMDDATSLQITDILNEMTDISNVFSRKPSKAFAKIPTDNSTKKCNVLNINVNKANTTISKHIWNIPVNASKVEMALDDSVGTTASNVTVPSNVTTLERISDIDLVESKLNSLKILELETTL